MLTPLLQPECVAEILGVKPKAVHEYVRKGLLSCVQLSPKDRRFTESQVLEFIANRTMAAPKRIDKPASKPVRSPRKGGLKSSGVNRARLREEMRSW
jgi:hypothetical protein